MAHQRSSNNAPLLAFLLLMAWCVGLLTTMADRLWPVHAAWPWLVLAPLLLLLALARPSQWGRDREERVANALRLAALAPGVLAMLLLEGMALRLVGLPESAKLTNERPAMVFIALVFAVFFAVLLGAASRALSRTGTQRRLAPALAAAALLLGTGLSVAGAVRLRAHPRGYLEGLERAGELAPAGRSDTLSDQIKAPPFGLLSVVRQCSSGTCIYALSLDEPPPAIPPSNGPTLPDEPVEVRTDAARDMIFVGTPGGHLAFSVMPETHDMVQLHPGLKELAPRLAPPPYWLASAAGGVAAALSLLLRGRRWARLVRQLRHARSGRVHGGAWVRPDDGGEDLPLPAGHGFANDAQVTVLYSEQGASYREGTALHEVVEGSWSVNAHRAEGRLRWHQSLAAAVALVTAAPLLVAKLLGLL